MCDHARLIRIYRLAVKKTAHKIMSVFVNKRVLKLPAKLDKQIGLNTPFVFFKN